MSLNVFDLFDHHHTLTMIKQIENVQTIVNRRNWLGHPHKMFRFPSPDRPILVEK